MAVAGCLSDSDESVTNDPVEGDAGLPRHTALLDWLIPSGPAVNVSTDALLELRGSQGVVAVRLHFAQPFQLTTWNNDVGGAGAVWMFFPMDLAVQDACTPLPNGIDYVYNFSGNNNSFDDETTRSAGEYILLYATPDEREKGVRIQVGQGNEPTTLKGSHLPINVQEFAPLPMDASPGAPATMSFNQTVFIPERSLVFTAFRAHASPGGGELEGWAEWHGKNCQERKTFGPMVGGHYAVTGDPPFIGGVTLTNVPAGDYRWAGYFEATVAQDLGGQAGIFVLSP